MKPTSTSLPINEPVQEYRPNSSERERLKTELLRQTERPLHMDIVVDGQRQSSSLLKKVTMPHSHRETLGTFSWAEPQTIEAAIQGALKAKVEWAAQSPEFRISIFERAAELLATKYRAQINAATMLGQSKNAYQAEIDAACELIDFFRFNVHFYKKIIQEQPLSPEGIHNSMEYRPLDGFCAAITPFNFTAIAGNLPSAPALMGNTVIWKPSDTQMVAAFYIYQILEEAGLPPGVIQFVPSDGPTFGKIITDHADLGGIHFTGSTQTFSTLWKSVSSRLDHYRSFPRLVGETGGKDFILAHPSADPVALTVAMVRGAYEYQGQKCSAASRAYIPSSVWEKIQEPLLEEIQKLKMGDVRNFENFVNAVIDKKSFDRLQGVVEKIQQDPNLKIIQGGKFYGETGYFMEPTLVVSSRPDSWAMQTEFFGPLLTVYVYDDNDWEKTIDWCESTSTYALTGAIFCKDEHIIQSLLLKLKFAAGNFYINDKPTGAVVGQQPFGGSRKSGTNDKSGSLWNLIRWTSPRTIKRNLSPPKSVSYPNFSN